MKNKKWIYKALAIVLGVTAGVGSFGACSCANEGEIPVSLPNYAATSEIDIIGYVNPTNGDYKFEGVPMNDGVDHRTVERFQEYTDAGFNIAFARYDSALPAETTKETWATSDTKIFCDKAYESGIRKILITDLYFDGLVEYKDGALIGTDETARYRTQEEMDADIAERLSIYKDTLGFYGVIMLDEPVYADFDNYALVYKSVKRALPDVFVYHNLHYASRNGLNVNRFVDADEWTAEHGKAPTLGEAYRHYLHTFLEKTGAENLSVDIYPFKDRPDDRLTTYFSNMQILREACDAYGAELALTMQSICYTQGETVPYRVVNKSDMWLQMNTALGFGATSVQYYTYFPYPSYRSDSTSIGNFIDRDGNKTSVYYNGQAVNNAVRKFDEVLLNYQFQGAKMYLNSVVQNGSASMYVGSDEMALKNDWEHTLLKNLTLDNDALFTTELKDEENGLYMYMIMNAIDSLFAQNGKMRYTDCTFTAEFTGYDYVAEFDCGELRYVKLDNGKYTKSLSSGYAVYLIPLKA